VNLACQFPGSPVIKAINPVNLVAAVNTAGCQIM
jgi:hypothetical protein